jgi:hypothetical protein
VVKTPVLEPEVTTADLAKTAPSRGAPELPEERLEQNLATNPPEIGPPPPLFTAEETLEFRRRWMEVQTAFVDEPRPAVQAADKLVAETMKRLAEVFARERSRLESQWGRGDEVSTEDLRQAMRRYRSFFDRLLAV